MTDPFDEVDDDADVAFDQVFSHSSPQDRAEGWRLHLFREKQGNVRLAEEQVLPEKIDDLHVNRIMKSNRICLNRADVEWLHDRLGEIRAQYATES